MKKPPQEVETYNDEHSGVFIRRGRDSQTLPHLEKGQRVQKVQHRNGDMVKKVFRGERYRGSVEIGVHYS
jgi:hypothetical protein